MRQALAVEIVPRRGPLVGERFQAQFPATRNRCLVATMELNAIHTEFLYL